MAHEPGLACGPLKQSRRVYEREAKQPSPKGLDKAAAQPFNSKWPRKALRINLYLILQTSTA